MQFKLDENLPLELAPFLRARGHDAVTVADQRLTGSDDSDLAAVCKNEGRVLMTTDLDFADIRAYPPEEYPGLIVFRMVLQSKRRVMTLCGGLLSLLDEEEVSGKLWIVEDTDLRIRGGEAS